MRAQRMLCSDRNRGNMESAVNPRYS